MTETASFFLCQKKEAGFIAVLISVFGSAKRTLNNLCLFLFKNSFKLICCDMRDVEIRKALHQNYLRHYWEDGESIVLDELPVCAGRTIADLAVVNGSLHVFEIKGTFDSLQRLEGQISNYEKVFDYITIVTTKNHLNGILKSISENHGIWLMAEKDGVISKEEIRAPKRNTFVDTFATAQLLWKEEALSLLIDHGISKGLKGKRKWIIWQKLAESFSIDSLSSQVRHKLKSRINWKDSRFSPMELPVEQLLSNDGLM